VSTFEILDRKKKKEFCFVNERKIKKKLVLMVEPNEKEDKKIEVAGPRYVPLTYVNNVLLQ
jgi:hypothetical protein